MLIDYIPSVVIFFSLISIAKQFKLFGNSEVSDTNYLCNEVKTDTVYLVNPSFPY